MGRFPCPHPDSTGETGFPTDGRQFLRKGGATCAAGWPGRLVTNKRGLFAFLLGQISKICSPDWPQAFGNSPASSLTHTGLKRITLGTESLLTPIGSILALHPRTQAQRVPSSTISPSEPSTKGWDSVVGAGRKAVLGGCLASSPQPAWPHPTLLVLLSHPGFISWLGPRLPPACPAFQDYK